MKRVMIKANFEEEKLKGLGYVFYPIEGGYVSSDGATIVNIYRSPYQRQVMQFKRDAEVEHEANIEQLNQIGALESITN